jgi:hypothetical protein
MQTTGFNGVKGHVVRLTLAAGLIATLSAMGQTPAKKAAAPAKPAAAPAKAATPAAKPAAAGAKPAGATAGGAAHGPTTAGAAAHGPTTAGAGAHGITTGSPHGPEAHGAMAGGPGAHPGGPGAHPGGPMNAHAGPMGRPGPAGMREVHGPNGDVRMRAGGRPMDVHDARRGMDIHHNLVGGRRVMVDRPGGGHMYYERGRPGYVGRPYMAHGHEFERRSYYYHGRAYDRYYRPYPYHGYALAVYSPTRYYGPGFYGWAYNPWASPVSYAWGFGGSPWYGYYGAYYTPYPVYNSPSLWLTDYLISQTLASAYTAQQEAGTAAAAYSGPPMSPEVKQLVSSEVQQEIALENAEAQQNAQQQVPDPASSGIARLLSDGKPHVFVAGKEVDVVDPGGRECALTDGDVVQLTAPPGPADTTANVTVLSSKGGAECPRSGVVAIGLDELQDMNNHMREMVDQGMGELQAKQGKGGLPAAPPSAQAPPATALVAENAPPPDPGGQAELTQQAVGGPAAADAAPVAAAPAAVPAATVSIAPGQSPDQVKAALGEPTRVVNLGAKTMFFYKDMKITFNNGKVTNIE